VHNVLGWRGYTMEGDLLELGGRAPDGPGLDLLALTIGSEGLLMIVTEVTVKLIPGRPAPSWSWLRSPMFTAPAPRSPR